MGAFIKIKSPFRSRAALFDIGIAGPIAGFIVAVPMALVGLLLSRPVPAEIDPATVQLGQPLIFQLLHSALHVFSIGSTGHLPLSQIFLHPVALAAWIGMMATAFNLVPGGQLDGGHIIAAVWPSAHETATRFSMMLLVPLAFFYWPGWFIWVIILGLTIRHPQVPTWPDLNVPRRNVAILAGIIFLLTFVPEPFPGGSLYDLVRSHF
jgi:membrane-associated protease RseP (regulator of RpoE activity)